MDLFGQQFEMLSEQFDGFDLVPELDLVHAARNLLGLLVGLFDDLEASNGSGLLGRERGEGPNVTFVVEQALKVRKRDVATSVRTRSPDSSSSASCRSSWAAMAAAMSGFLRFSWPMARAVLGCPLAVGEDPFSNVGPPSAGDFHVEHTRNGPGILRPDGEQATRQDQVGDASLVANALELGNGRCCDRR